MGMPQATHFWTPDEFRALPEDGHRRLVERWRPGDERQELLAETLAWRPETSRDPLTVDLQRFLAHVLGDPS
jgi:hypothetical protein